MIGDTETWIDVDNTDGDYQVSNRGNVRSTDRIITYRDGRVYSYIGVDLAPCINSTGRYTVNIYDKNMPVHKLVAEAFVGTPIDPKLEVCHNDGNCLNNASSNLRWDTRKANIGDMIKDRTFYQLKKTECKYGHKLLEPNLVPSAQKIGKRICLSCQRAYGVGLKKDSDMFIARSNENYEKIMGGK